MDDRRIGALLSLDPEDRYWHTVAEAARAGLVWSLRGPEGWLMPLAPEGFEFLPVWAHRRLAQVVGDLAYPGLLATELPLDVLRGEWLDELTKGGVRIGVSPDPDGRQWTVSAAEFLDAVEDEAQTRI